MLRIPVIYVDGHKGMVTAEELDLLIKARKIVSFRRSGGWVRVAFDLLRGEGGGDYAGPDRRNHLMYEQIAKLRYIFTTNETNRYNNLHRKLMNRLFREKTPA